ncbi:MAG: hypothetical protein HY906_21145 [Deltaproteobacteria bacterium]|nr:hypothetical protein [Deltaproteobacteria bacterium]
MPPESGPDERAEGEFAERADEAEVRGRIADLLDSGPNEDAREQERSHRHRHGHRHSHRHGSRHKKRLTPRPAKLQWWHIVLILLVGLLVTWVVVAIASSPAGPPPE